jgi:hypothetical protein
MDIQFAYNLERLLFYMCGDTRDVRSIMARVDDQFSFKQGAAGVWNRVFICIFIFLLFLFLLFLLSLLSQFFSCPFFVLHYNDISIFKGFCLGIFYFFSVVLHQSTLVFIILICSFLFLFYQRYSTYVYHHCLTLWIYLICYFFKS